MPNNATHAQSDLGLDNSVAAFDINLACSGYVYGLWVAGMMAGSLKKAILLLDGDKQSYLTSPYDKATSLLFGDAGSATLIIPEASDETEFSFAFYADGSRRDSLIIKNGAARNTFSEKSLDYVTGEDGSRSRDIDIRMDGMEIFKFVVQDAKRNILEYMEMLGRTPENYD
jgi:3-oxoacyl-[acyl-carrier-protein] synthase-3